MNHPRARARARLHLDRVALLERAVEDPGRVDDLPAQVAVVAVPDKERLRRERVRLDVDVGARDLCGCVRVRVRAL